MSASKDSLPELLQADSVFAWANQRGLTFEQAQHARQFGLACYLAGLEAASLIADDMDYGMGEIAAAIRAEKQK